MSDESLRVGILFSQSGYFGSTEIEHLRGAILAIADINAAGGVLGRLIEPIICDPASNPARLHDLAHELIVHEGVVSLFGCASSSMRKVLVPLVERLDTLLWYPTQFEGFEYSPNVFYGGPCPNQYVLPLARWMAGQGRHRVAMLGLDYLFPRECNRVMRSLVRQYGGEVCAEQYLPLDAGLREHGVALQQVMQQQPDVIFSTLVGPASVLQYQAFHQAGLQAATTPIASVSVTEAELAQGGREWFHGHISSLPYFESMETAENQHFVQRFRQRFGPQARANFMTESAYVQMQLFARAAGQAACTSTGALREAAVTVEYEGPHGVVRIDPQTHYTYYGACIGQMDALGGFELLQHDSTLMAPDPYLVAAP